MVSEPLKLQREEDPSMAVKSVAASSSSSTSSLIPPNLALLVSNLHSFVTLKLDSSNFIVWKNQLQIILRATGLLGYVDGSIACPPLKIKNAEGIEVTNDAFLEWEMIDAHLLSCITATVIPNLHDS
ncbi:hypothetical protein Vadar_017584 [Vaccinium darrowii]|uniref:Uncharacterized protein n=1 Tax=Vaccinium darrowii TaxID=229202 RepID=A0ACB7YFG9_9ERIC|nr:hypothetical protein Vadar_017584 [Vaccinium darrowii]